MSKNSKRLHRRARSPEGQDEGHGEAKDDAGGAVARTRGTRRGRSGRGLGTERGRGDHWHATSRSRDDTGGDDRPHDGAALGGGAHCRSRGAQHRREEAGRRRRRGPPPRRVDCGRAGGVGKGEDRRGSGGHGSARRAAEEGEVRRDPSRCSPALTPERTEFSRRRLVWPPDRPTDRPSSRLALVGVDPPDVDGSGWLSGREVILLPSCPRQASSPPRASTTRQGAPRWSRRARRHVCRDWPTPRRRPSGSERSRGSDPPPWCGNWVRSPVRSLAVSRHPRFSLLSPDRPPATHGRPAPLAPPPSTGRRF